MIDILAALEELVPDAEFLGSVSEGTQEQYNELIWDTVTEKPLWEDVITKSNEIIIRIAKFEQIKIIKQALEDNQYGPVTTVVNDETIYWVGGWVSGIKIDAVWRLSMTMNQPSVSCYDYYGNTHVLSHKDTENLIKTIGYMYEMGFQKREGLIVLINSYEKTTTNTLEEVLEQIKSVQW